MGRSRNDARGGPKETVERFVDEVWIANMTLRLYEAASNPEGPDVDAIVGFMPDQLHGGSPEAARSWARSLVEEIVERQVRGRCWPIPVQDGSSHGEGWAFDSLLGTMWLQMQWLMRGARRCEWCGKLLDMDAKQAEQSKAGTADAHVGRRKSPSHKRFCSDTTCRQKWNYRYGTGKSSKVAKKRERDRNKSRKS